jgi:hypothetical protein
LFAKGFVGSKAIKTDNQIINNIKMSKEIFDTKADNDKLILDIPKDKRHLNTSSYDYSVAFLVSMMQEGKIILAVPFQRQYVWKDDKASQLIESIIMNVPIPPIYFAEEEDGKWLVVDGLQRLNSLKRYFENEFALKKLDIVKDLEKNKYKDLPPKAKSLLENGQLRANVIRKDSHPDIKYDIFMRLNKGAVTLNYQELRNCLYRGDLNNIAKEIVENNEAFLQILKLKEPHNRFLDVEFIVRFFALYENLKLNEEGNYEVEGYKGRMVTYLNEYMSNNKVMPAEKRDEFLNLFNDTIEKVVAVFGIDNAFRDLTATKSKANKALADCILLSFTYHSLDVLTGNRDLIVNTLRELLVNDNNFKTSISQRTSDTDVLNNRIDRWIKHLNNAI